MIKIISIPLEHGCLENAKQLEKQLILSNFLYFFLNLQMAILTLYLTSSFFFSHIVFKICLTLICQNEWLWSKGLNLSAMLTDAVLGRCVNLTWVY